MTPSLPAAATAIGPGGLIARLCLCLLLLCSAHLQAAVEKVLDFPAALAEA